MIKKSNEYTLKEAIKELLEFYRLDNKLDEVKLVAGWEEVVGEMIGKHTEKLYFRQGVLFVHVDSAALRNELVYSREKILKSLNDKAGKDLVKDIVFR